MARGRNGGTTIVLKKVEDGGHGHHGGAWKVAYADFVTAMMAFFLLMWLLNATTQEQRQGIADYFAPTNVLGRSQSGSRIISRRPPPSAARNRAPASPSAGARRTAPSR